MYRLSETVVFLSVCIAGGVDSTIDDEVPSGSLNFVPVRPLVQAAKVLFVLFLFAVLFWMAPLGRTVRVVLSSSLVLLAAACFIRTALLLLSGIKLHLLLPRRPSSDASVTRRLRELLGLYTIGRFFTNFIPTSVGGDVVKVREMSIAGYTLSDATWAVFLERFTGILAVYVLAIAALMPGTGLPEIFGLAPWRYWILVVLLVPLGVPLYLSRWGLPAWLNAMKRRFFDWQTVLPDDVTSIDTRVSGRIFTAVFGVSLVYHVTRVLLLGTLVLAIGRSVSLWGLLGAIPIITFVSLLPVSLGNLGLREGAITFCLTALGLTAPEAFGVAVLSRLIGFGVSLVGGIVYLLRPIPGEAHDSSGE